MKKMGGILIPVALSYKLNNLLWVHESALKR